MKSRCCTLCESLGTNKNTCPLNPYASNINIKKHSKLKKYGEIRTGGGSKTKKEINIIEKELLRKKLYQEILDWMKSVIKDKLQNKDIQHMLLRYIFNKIITRTKGDDPIFIITPSIIADNQMRKDFNYFKLSLNVEKFISILKNKINDASNKIKLTKIPKDKKVLYDQIKKHMYYQGKSYYDINNMVDKYKTKMNYLIALNIRYNYLHLTTHGLANLYNRKYNKKDGTEGFASVFNHYFDKYCTAFPDLEKPFGSIGSFFEVDHWTTEKVFVNPPFDEALIIKMVEKIYNDIDKANKADKKIKFIITLPYWRDFYIINELIYSHWTINYTEYKKGKLPFYDYMTKQMIYPSDIIEITMSN